MDKLGYIRMSKDVLLECENPNKDDCTDACLSRVRMKMLPAYIGALDFLINGWDEKYESLENQSDELGEKLLALIS